MEETTHHLSFKTLLSAYFLLCSLYTYAANYYFVGNDNDWGDDLMLLSAGGCYYYYELKTNQSNGSFDIEDYDNSITYNRAYVQSGFNGTDIAMTEGASGDAKITASAGSYILFWLPNTYYNSNNTHVISASTTLPNDAAACTAPVSVTVNPTETDGWGRFGGETISLSAVPVGGSGAFTYQWKLNGVAIPGATSPTYTKPNCSLADAGNYTCVISTGPACSAESADYFVKVYTLQKYGSNTTSYNFTREGNSKVGRAEVTLSSNGSDYQFKIFAGGAEYYGNNGRVTADVSNWTWETGKNNCRIYTSWTGTFTFIIDYTGNGGAPKVSVLYPRKAIYMVCGGSWCNDNPKFYAHTWGNADYDAELTEFACASSIYSAEIPVYNNNLVITRQNPASTSIVWSGNSYFWNQSQDLTIGSYNKFTFSNWNNEKGVFSRGTYTLPTFTISFSGNGKDGGSMSNMTGIVCDNSATLPTNAFTRTGYAFTGWNTNADGSGTSYADGATIPNVSGNMTLYAQWSPCVIIPGTISKDNESSHIASMTWYGPNNEYYDFGPGSGTNTDRWVEWYINLTSSGKYIVTEDFETPANGTDWYGHQWSVELLDVSRNVVSTYNTTAVWSAGGERTDNVQWDLRNVPTGVYIIRVTNAMSWGRPKLKSLTFEHAGLSLAYTKVPDAADYHGGASGEIYHPGPVVTSHLQAGATIIVVDSTLIIGDDTITAPAMTGGKLNNVPVGISASHPDGLASYGCVWQFDHWENVPATITDDISDIEAVYYPSFRVAYDTNGGTINDSVYAHWYRYTGNEHDHTALPENVSKAGYIFAGWYQESTTELFSYLTGNYYGDYDIECGVGPYSIDCDYRLKAHWILPCDEPQVISRVTLTGSGTSSYTVFGYNDNEYAGTPIVSVGATTAAYDLDGDSNDEIGYQLSAGNDIVFATLRKGGFRVGDMIRVAVTAPNTNRIVSGTYDMLELYYGTGAGNAKLLVHIKNVKNPGIYEYYLDSDDVIAMNAAGATGVGVVRTVDNGQNQCIYSVEVYGCRDLIFDDNHGTHLWSDPLNWAPTYTEIPAYYQAARILKPCTVDIANAHAHNIKLCREYTGHDGSLTINADAALAVIDRVSEVYGIDYNTLHDVTADHLLIRANVSNQGALAHGDTGGHTHATVEFYARGTGAPDLTTATWQYLGVPFSDANRAINLYQDGWMCRWIEDVTGNAGYNWKWINNNDALTPFVGYGLTQADATTYTNTGTLVSSVDQTLTLTCAGTDYRGWNMFANSWMAPIKIADFQAADFGDAQAAIYLFNTGINEGDQASCPESSSAGQYVAIPIASASSMLADNQHIAPMQGFYIVTEAPTTVTLNYNRLVRNASGNEDDPLSVHSNRAPRHSAQDEAMPRIVIDVNGNLFSDRLYLFENAEQTDTFDNAWDGLKFEGEAYAPQLMTRTSGLELAVDVSPSFDGKRIAFRAGEDTEYTLRFSTSETGLYLRDLTTDQEIEITDGSTYAFFTYAKECEERFEIVDRRSATVTPTILDNTAVTKPTIIELTVYTIDGRLIEHRTADFNLPLNLPQSGIYIVHLRTTAGMQVEKIKF